jgi:hypothetical protein
MSKCLFEYQTNVYVCTQNMNQTNGNVDVAKWNSSGNLNNENTKERKKKETAKHSRKESFCCMFFPIPQFLSIVLPLLLPLLTKH